MDIGDYDTNTLVVANIASITFKIYGLRPGSSTQELTRASTIACEIRDTGALVHVEFSQAAIWLLGIISKDSQNHDPIAAAARELTSRTRGLGLVLRSEGSVEPAAFFTTSEATSAVPLTASLSTPASATPLTRLSDTQTASPVVPELPATTHDTLGSSTDPAARESLISRAPTCSQTDVSPRAVYRTLLWAVYAGISRSMCSRFATHPIDMRSWILPWQQGSSYPGYSGDLGATHIIVSSKVYMTSAGSLVIQLAASPFRGPAFPSEVPQPLRSGHGSTTVIAAPYGAVAVMRGQIATDLASQAHRNPNGLSDKSTPTQVNHDEKSNLYRRAFDEILRSRAVPLDRLTDCTWLDLHLRISDTNPIPHDQGLGHVVRVRWPSFLCLTPWKTLASTSTRLISPIVDVLTEAKNWCTEDEVRRDLIAERSKSRGMAPSITGGSSEHVDHQSQGISAHTLRRVSHSQHAAAGSMYPTPPDGIQVLADSTTALRDPSSSPEDTSMRSVPPNHDDLVTDSGANVDHSSDWSDTPKRAQTDAALMLEDDNMFGDIGGDVFSNIAITDADFNFFDEEPDHTTDLSGLAVLAPRHDEMVASGSEKIVAIEVAELPATIETALASADDAEFTKPELRHARSIMAPITPSKNSTSTSPTQTTKRQPSPFNQETIYKRLKASRELRDDMPLADISNILPRRSSIYNRIAFARSATLINSKYQLSGQFDVPVETINLEDTPLSNVDTTDSGPLRESGKPKTSSKGLPPGVGALVARLSRTSVDAMAASIRSSKVGDVSDDDMDSLASEQNESSESDHDDGISDTAHSRDHDDPTQSRDRPAQMAATPDNLLVLFESRMATGNGALDLQILSESRPAELSTFVSDRSMIMVAQILTDQIVSCPYRLGVFGGASNNQVSSATRLGVMNIVRNAFKILRDIVPSGLGQVQESHFSELLSIQDVAVPGQLIRPVMRGPDKLHNLIRLPAQHLELRRNDTKLSILPSAIGFWESLGLQPLHGGKSISAVCAYSYAQCAEDDVNIFLERVRSVYETLKLGSCDFIGALGSSPKGHFAYKLDSDDAQMSGVDNETLQGDSLENLAHMLANSSTEAVNLVVYLIYTSEDPVSILDCCKTFSRIREAYRRTMAEEKKPISNGLVLQLVPQDMIGRPTTLAMPSPTDYSRLCLSLYDRCAAADGSAISPALTLERIVSKPIEFQLNNASSSSVLKENSCLHIAYSQSIDRRWISAAWSDTQGAKQMTASYCLGKRGMPLTTSFSEVAKEIWETTIDFTSSIKVHWRLIITKCKPMAEHELHTWTGLNKAETRTAVSLILLNVDTNPALQLVPPIVKIPDSAISGLYVTPVSTPQASVSSPEQVTTPATPGIGPLINDASASVADATALEANPDTTLVDTRDSCWGAVLGHRLTQSATTTDILYALVSGYLVQQGGSRVEDPPVIMEVNMLHCEGNPRLAEMAFREILTQMRGLGTLAKARSLNDDDADVRPWHVAAVEKAVRILYQLM